MHVINLAPNISCIRFGTGPLDPTAYLETNEDQERSDKNKQKRIQTLSLMNQNHNQVSSDTAKCCIQSKISSRCNCVVERERN